MTRDSRIFSKLGSFINAAIFVATFSAACIGQQETLVDGLWAQGNTIVLLARFDQCGGPYRPVQPIVSTDGGTMWAVDGPRFEGSELLFILSEGNELLIGGQVYAEGPTSSPFLLIYSFNKHQWSQIDIYSYAAELLGMAREKETGHLLAWVRHIDMESETYSGPIYLHESVDDGETWDVTRDVAHVPASVPGLRFFQELPKRSGRWRVARAGNAIEQLKDDGKWHRTMKLPLPIQQQCPVNEDDTRP